MKLTPVFTFPTSGARCVTLFKIDNDLFIGLPQLAEDIADTPADMNGGNSNTYASLFKLENDSLQLFQKLPVQGGEHIDFGLIDGKPMLAVANIRSGQAPNFNTRISSQIFVWEQNEFKLHQSIPTFAAKSTCFFTLNNRYFLGISEGVIESEADKQTQSYNHIYEWREGQFTLFQALESTWGYDMSFFQIEDKYYLAVGDNSQESNVYVWQDDQFILKQRFSENGGGRGFCHFSIDGKDYLAFANLLYQSYLYKWDGEQFVEVQAFPGEGTRRFHFANIHGENYLFRVNFITGTRDNPTTKQSSIVYRWQHTQFEVDTTFTTLGGTGCATFMNDGTHYLVVANSLSEQARFRVDSVLYKIL